jgi:hypothetical protein
MLSPDCRLRVFALLGKSLGVIAHTASGKQRGALSKRADDGIERKLLPEYSRKTYLAFCNFPSQEFFCELTF